MHAPGRFKLPRAMLVPCMSDMVEQSELGDEGPSGIGLATQELSARGRALWERYRIVLQPMMMLVGVAWDFLTLRVERTFDHLLLVGYLVGLITLYALQMRLERGRAVPDWVAERGPQVALGTSFMLGALLSALGVVVVRAFSPGPVLVLLVLFGAIAIANEAEVRALRGDVVRYALVAAFAFQLGSLLTPFITGYLVGPAVGAGTAILAVVALWIAVEVGHGSKARTWARDAIAPVGGSASAILLLSLLIQVGVVPPLPALLRDVAVASNVERVGSTFEVERLGERRRPIDWMVEGVPEIPWAPGDGISVFAAIFVPPLVAMDVITVWEHWDADQQEWVPTERIEQSIHGGRVEGWRTWTRKQNLLQGSWRVRFETPEGREIGRTRFDLVPADGSAMTTERIRTTWEAGLGARWTAGSCRAARTAAARA